MVISMEELCPVVTIYSIYLKCTVYYRICCLLLVSLKLLLLLPGIEIIFNRKIVITGLIRGYRLDTKISINANLHWKYVGKKKNQHYYICWYDIIVLYRYDLFINVNHIERF